MRLIFIISFLLIILLPINSYAKRYALVIGNSQYSSDIGKIINSVNDANDISVLLKKKEFK